MCHSKAFYLGESYFHSDWVVEHPSAMCMNLECVECMWMMRQGMEYAGYH